MLGGSRVTGQGICRAIVFACYVCSRKYKVELHRQEMEATLQVHDKGLVALPGGYDLYN